MVNLNREVSEISFGELFFISSYTCTKGCLLRAACRALFLVSLYSPAPAPAPFFRIRVVLPVAVAEANPCMACAGPADEVPLGLARCCDHTVTQAAN